MALLSFTSTTVILTRLQQQFWICCHLLMPPLPPVHRLLFSYPSVWKNENTCIHISFFFNIFHWLLYSEYTRSYILKQELLTFHYGLLSLPFQYPSPEPEILQCNLQSAINTNQSTLLIDSALNLLNNLKISIFWQSQATRFTSNLKLKNRAPTTMADRSRSRDCMAKNIAEKTFLWEHSATNSQSLHPWFYKNISNYN